MVDQKIINKSSRPRVYLKSFEEIFPHLSGITATEAFYSLSGSSFDLSVIVDNCQYFYGEYEYYLEKEVDLGEGMFYNCLRATDNEETVFVNIKPEWVERITK